jgi:hypothetical protein
MIYQKDATGLLQSLLGLSDGPWRWSAGVQAGVASAVPLAAFTLTPGPDEVQYPVLLNLPAPRLHSYPVYTVIDEKLEAMVLLGEANSRMRDFYDVRFLSVRFEFDGKTLVEVIRATFDRRKTKLPDVVPAALTDEFAAAMTPQWNAFSGRNNLTAKPFSAVVVATRVFAAPPLLASEGEGGFLGHWSAGAWRSRP